MKPVIRTEGRYRRDHGEWSDWSEIDLAPDGRFALGEFGGGTRDPLQAYAAGIGWVAAEWGSKRWSGDFVAFVARDGAATPWMRIETRVVPADAAEIGERR